MFDLDGCAYSAFATNTGGMSIQLLGVPFRCAPDGLSLAAGWQWPLSVDHDDATVAGRVRFPCLAGPAEALGLRTYLGGKAR